MVYIIRHVWHIPLLCAQWKTPDGGQRNRPKHVEFHSKFYFEKLVHLVCFIIRDFIIRNICTWQLHVILSPQTPWSKFRADSPVTSVRNFWAALKCTSVALWFPKSASLLLLQMLIETVQFVVTIKCALDRSVYNVMKKDYRIKINCFVLFGAQMSKRNIKLWNSYKTIVL